MYTYSSLFYNEINTTYCATKFAIVTTLQLNTPRKNTYYGNFGYSIFSSSVDKLVGNAPEMCGRGHVHHFICSIKTQHHRHVYTQQRAGQQGPIWTLTAARKNVQSWRNETGSLFQRWGDECQNERFVIFNEELTWGWARVTTEEVRVQRGGCEMWQDLGALTTLRARELWMSWRWFMWDLGLGDWSRGSCSNQA